MVVHLDVMRRRIKPVPFQHKQNRIHGLLCFLVRQNPLGDQSRQHSAAK